MDDTVTRCVLAHRGFVLLGELVFQRSQADGVPVAVVAMDGCPVCIPLRALQRELAIDDDSDDGRMLARIAEALDYVVSLRPCDPLPAEVLTGEASWRPEPRHVAASRQRLLARIRRWAEARGACDRPADIDAALAALAPLTGSADATEAAGRLDSLAAELAFIEASRDLLLRPVFSLAGRLDQLRATSALGTQRDELTQSRRLSAIALERIGARFADVERQTGDIVVALRRVEGLRTYIRSNRDWLHRSRLAWAPVLHGWDHERGLKASARHALVGLTYRFLARRFMSVQEWRLAEARRATLKAEAVFEW